MEVPIDTGKMEVPTDTELPSATATSEDEIFQSDDDEDDLLERAIRASSEDSLQELDPRLPYKRMAYSEFFTKDSRKWDDEDVPDGRFSDAWNKIKLGPTIGTRRKPRLVFVDGLPGAGTTRVAHLLSFRLNDIMSESLKQAPKEYIDLCRIINDHRNRDNKALFKNMPNLTNHPYYDRIENYLGWKILALLEFYKKREKTVHPDAMFTVCDTSPFWIAESLLSDAKYREYLVKEQSSIIDCLLWGLITYLASNYTIFRVFVHRPYPTLVKNRVCPNRVCGYTNETTEYDEKNLKSFKAVNKLAHPVIHYYNGTVDEEDVEVIVDELLKYI